MTDHLIALCKVCGNNYDLDFEPPLECHWGVDDWELLTFHDDDDLAEVLLDLTDQWHDGDFGSEIGLREVIIARTGWTEDDYNQWVSRGTVAELGARRGS